MRRVIAAAGAERDLKAAIIRSEYYMARWDDFVERHNDNRALADQFAGQG